MKSKTALITGGSRGLGRDMALNLAKNGINVLITYHSNREAADEVVSEIKGMGLISKAFQYDSNQWEQGNQLIQSIQNYLNTEIGSSKFDFLINNAGTGTYNKIQDTQESQFDEMMNVHLKSIYFLTQKSLTSLNDGGSIINISSGLTRFSFPGMSAYAMMKGAIEVFTRYLAKELGDRKITANVVAPGAIATDFAGGSNKDPEKSAIISSITALGRVGEAEDIGGLLAFLCSDKAKWVNGQRIEASGGMLV